MKNSTSLDFFKQFPLFNVLVSTALREREISADVVNSEIFDASALLFIVEPFWSHLSEINSITSLVAALILECK